MSRRAILVSTALVGVLLAAPAAAQTPAGDKDAEIAAIRQELARVTALAQQLNARLDALEGSKAGADAAPVVTQPAQPTPPAMTPSPPAPATLIATSDDRDLSAVAALSSRVAPLAPTDRALAGRDGFSSEISASADATTVAIKLSKTDSSAGLETGVYTTWSATASAPLNSGSKFSDLGTLDGFSNSARLRLQYSRYIRPLSEPDQQPGYDDLIARVRTACLRRLGAAAKTCAPDIVDSGFIHDNAPDLEAEYLSLFRMTGTPPKVDWSAYAYGFEGSVGYKSFKYLQSGPAREDKVDRTPWSARAFYSWLPDIRSDAFTAAIEYQRTYKDATQAALCPVVVATVELTCKVGPLGRPKGDEKLLWSVEYRHQFRSPGSYFPSVGVSTLLTYDSRNDVFGIDIPVYLVNDPKNGLTSGVRFGYRDDQDDLVVGVFVGSAFSLK